MAETVTESEDEQSVNESETELTSDSESPQDLTENSPQRISPVPSSIDAHSPTHSQYSEPPLSPQTPPKLVAIIWVDSLYLPG